MGREVTLDFNEHPQVKDVRITNNGVVELDLVYAPDELHESLTWNLATELFGQGGWHVASYGFDRHMLSPGDFALGLPARFSRWYTKYTVRGEA